MHHPKMTPRELTSNNQRQELPTYRPPFGRELCLLNSVKITKTQQPTDVANSITHPCLGTLEHLRLQGLVTKYTRVRNNVTGSETRHRKMQRPKGEPKHHHINSTLSITGRVQPHAAQTARARGRGTAWFQ